MGRDGDMKRKRGRPVGKDGGRYEQVMCKLTEAELRALREASLMYGKSQSDIIREGIKKQINMMKYQK